MSSALADRHSYREPRILGNARAFSRDPVELLTAAHARCGDVACVPLAGRLVLYSVRHPDAIHRVLVENGDNYVKGDSYKWLRRAVGIGLLTADGAESRWRRASIGPGFGRGAINANVGLVRDCVARTRARWLEGPPIVDVHREMSDLTLRVIGRLLFGIDLTLPEHHALREGFWNGARTVRRLMGSASQFLPYAPTPTNFELWRGRALIDRELDALIDRKLREGTGDGGGELFERMLALWRGDLRANAARTYRTRRELREEATVLVGAGHETTANLLSWTWHFIAREPDVERRLHAELAAELGGREPDAGDLARLGYVARVLEESLRIMPPAWGILRQAVGRDVVDGIAIPPGALVIVSPYVVHRDPRWYPDPDRFDPDRHTEERRATRPKLSYLPFGLGARACIGKLLAEVESQVAVAILAQAVRLEEVPGETVERETSVTLQPRGGLRMRVVARTR